MDKNNFLKLPRLNLAPLNTPLERMDRLSASFPSGPELFIKRDDFIGQLVWGNKLRKLEYTLAHAIASGADTVLTCGAIQSNHARTTAQVARRLGLDCLLVLNGTEPEVPTANFRIVKLTGVPVVIVSQREQRMPEMKRIAADLLHKGKKPYIIPLGASDQFGVPGFANAILELKTQMENMSTFFTHIYHSTSSGGTQAGMEAGKRIFGLERLKIVGVSADDSPDEIAEKVMECANPFLRSICSDVSLAREEITVYSDFVGDGYGIPTPGSTRARKLFLEKEGILLDDTYTSKAADALISHIESGLLKNSDRVVFWHTGGIINLF